MTVFDYFEACLVLTNFKPNFKDIEFNRYVWPICLPDNLPPPNDGKYDKNCTVAGWGDTRCKKLNLLISPKYDLNLTLI